MRRWLRSCRALPPVHRRAPIGLLTIELPIGGKGETRLANAFQRFLASAFVVPVLGVRQSRLDRPTVDNIALPDVPAIDQALREAHGEAVAPASDLHLHQASLSDIRMDIQARGRRRNYHPMCGMTKRSEERGGGKEGRSRWA